MNQASSNNLEAKKRNEDDLHFPMTLKKFMMIICSLSLLQAHLQRKKHELYFAITLKKLTFE